MKDYSHIVTYEKALFKGICIEAMCNLCIYEPFDRD